MNPEAAMKLHKKNGIVRADGDREQCRLSRDRGSACEQRTRELSALRRELVDMKACQVVNKHSRLAAQESRRSASKQAVLASLDLTMRSLVSRMLGGNGDAVNSGDGPVSSMATSAAVADDDDPFHLRAIVDVDCGLDSEQMRRGSTTAAAGPAVPLATVAPSSARQAKRVLRGAALYKHILAEMGQQRSQQQQPPQQLLLQRSHSILPGSCSFHSLKEYHEQQKRAVTRQWQPSERRRAQVRRALDGSPPPFVIDRSKTLTEIYSDFAQYRLRSSQTSVRGSKASEAGTKLVTATGGGKAAW